MRKFKTYLITVLVSLILIFCISHSKNTKDNMLIDKVPMAEKLTKMNINDIYKLKKEIEHIPLESCEVFFTDEIEIFLNNYNDIKLDSLHVEQDTLSVIAGQNNKSLYNLIFEINIVIDTTKNVNIYDDIIEISNQILDFLEEYGYINLKVKELNVNTLDLNKNMIHNVSRVHSIMNETIFIEQSEDEYAVQTLAFNFKNENSEFILQKFGILIEPNELYIEYLVNDEYFINKSIEESKLKLDETSLKIKEILLSAFCEA